MSGPPSFAPLPALAGGTDAGGIGAGNVGFCAVLGRVLMGARVGVGALPVEELGALTGLTLGVGAVVGTGAGVLVALVMGTPPAFCGDGGTIWLPGTVFGAAGLVFAAEFPASRADLVGGLSAACSASRATACERAQLKKLKPTTATATRGNVRPKNDGPRSMGAQNGTLAGTSDGNEKLRGEGAFGRGALGAGAGGRMPGAMRRSPTGARRSTATGTFTSRRSILGAAAGGATGAPNAGAPARASSSGASAAANGVMRAALSARSVFSALLGRHGDGRGSRGLRPVDRRQLLAQRGARGWQTRLNARDLRDGHIFWGGRGVGREQFVGVEIERGGLGQAVLEARQTLPVGGVVRRHLQHPFVGVHRAAQIATALQQGAEQRKRRRVRRVESNRLAAREQGRVEVALIGQGDGALQQLPRAPPVYLGGRSAVGGIIINRFFGVYRHLFGFVCGQGAQQMAAAATKLRVGRVARAARRTHDVRFGDNGGRRHEIVGRGGRKGRLWRHGFSECLQLLG